jgi:hypothetical protein
MTGKKPDAREYAAAAPADAGRNDKIKILLLFMLLIGKTPCIANDNIEKQNEYAPFSLEIVKLHISFSTDFYTSLFKDVTTNIYAGTGCAFTFTSEKNKDEEEVGGSLRLIEAGLLVEYNFDRLLKTSPYIFFGELDYTWIIGAQLYFGFLVPIITNFETYTLGLSPAIGLGIIGFGIFINQQIQYDFYIDNKYNRFLYSIIVSIPIKWF